MTLRITQVHDYEQFLLCLRHRLWGSRNDRFHDWQKGDFVAFKTGQTLLALAAVSGDSFESHEAVWPDDVYPFRVPLQFLHVLTENDAAEFDNEIKRQMRAAFGDGWGFQILNQLPVPDSVERAIIGKIKSHADSVDSTRQTHEPAPEIQPQQREPVQQSQGPRTPENTKQDIADDDENEHTAIQASLIALGKSAGCDVWIASNDKSKVFNGKRLGDLCLSEFPNVGLPPEASRRIKLIDIIWVSDGSPVSAFEVETSTTVYSGLLRMSDLVASVPNLYVDLYIVAPDRRRERVMSEIRRPTFEKLRLGESCMFVSSERLSRLVSRVEGLGSHFQPSIISEIAEAAKQANPK